MEELELVCQEAARNLVQRAELPLPTSVVLPLPDRTRVTSLEQWPAGDDDREALLDRFVHDVVRPANAPCYGLVAEAVAADEQDQPVDVVVVVFGARRNHPRITAAPLQQGQVGEFIPSEPLEPAAMPFVRVLQHAVDEATPPDAFSG
ncbi:MAG: hypothetical protein GEU74_06910 [Nitriliruptorales bacterium]|nr:hypothetical protein [Nitriliruptorales bacterium]